MLHKILIILLVLGSVSCGKTEFSSSDKKGAQTPAQAVPRVASSGNVEAGPDVSLSRIELNYQPQMFKGTSQVIKVTAVFADGNSRDVTSESAFAPRLSTILSAQDAGNIRALAVGADSVDVTFSNMKDVANITVIDYRVISIAISPPNKTMAIGETVSFSLTGVLEQNAGSVTLTDKATWSSSQSSFVSVSDALATKGKAQALAVGAANVIATYSGMTAQAPVTVAAPLLTKLDIVPASSSIKVGQSISLVAVATYGNGTTANVTNAAAWSVSQTAFASISASGLVNGLSSGTTGVTAYFGGKTANGTVNVSDNAPTCVTLTTSKTSVAVGESFILQVSAGGTVSSVNINGTTISTAPYSLSVSAAVAGNYNYAATITGPGGTASCSPVAVIVNPPPASAVCSALTSNVSQVLIGSHETLPTVTLTVTGSNIQRAVINGVTVQAAPFSTTATIPLNITSQNVVAHTYQAVNTFSAKVYNSAGVEVSCPTTSVTAIGYKIPDGLKFFYKAYDSSSRNFYGNAQYSVNTTAATPANVFYQQRCEAGVASGLQSNGTVRNLYFKINNKNYYLGDVVAIDPNSAVKIKNVTLYAEIQNSSSSGPKENLYSFQQGDIQFFFEGGSNNLAISQPGSGTSWPIGVGRGLNATGYALSEPSSSIGYPSCN